MKDFLYKSNNKKLYCNCMDKKESIAKKFLRISSYFFATHSIPKNFLEKLPYLIQ